MDASKLTDTAQEALGKGVDSAKAGLAAAAAAVTYPVRALNYRVDQTTVGQFCSKVETVATFGLSKPPTTPPSPLNFD